MPERDNFDRTTPNAIVEVVTNPGVSPIGGMEPGMIGVLEPVFEG
jgi:hypothetical protein